MRLSTELAERFHLLTAPEDYAEEAAEIVRLAEAAVDGDAATLPELGSGGGDAPARVVHDHHVEGLFARDEWLAWLREAAFEARAERVAVDGAPEWTAFVARRPL